MSRNPDVFRYLDYRSFLHDFYEERKRADRGFSYRVFSRVAGLKSPNHMKRVIDGERRLTSTMTRHYARALGLRGEEAAYFTELVRFNEAPTQVEKQDAHERIISFRGYRTIHRLELHQAAYHAHWYIPAVRELVLHDGFEDDPHWIAATMLPKITVEQARQALDTLLELGLLARDEDGVVVQTAAAVSTGAQAAKFHVTRYHLAMLERAAEALEIVPSPERDVSSLTFCIDADVFEKVRARVLRFRQELIGILASEKRGTRVFQLGIQLFPLTRREENP